MYNFIRNKKLILTMSIFYPIISQKSIQLLCSIQITSDVYAHISKKIEAISMDKFEKFTQNILK
jgi:hypothetical protein